ncbi:MAG TPA: hypothetical protein VKD22_05265, partial [Ramlibacter sp.]|nr:hypothetical protein [Ramlibacter sp.]
MQSTRAVLAEPSPGGTGAARAPVFVCAPQAVAASQLTQFTAALEAHSGRIFPTYEALHEFSVREYREFWRFFVLWSRQRLGWDGGVEPVC